LLDWGEIGWAGIDRVLGEPGASLPLVERVVDEAIAAFCAEAVGAWRRCTS
jgi:hypothetical protein